MSSVAPETLLDRIDRRDAVTVIDVRTAKEFADGHVPGAVNIPFQQMARRAAEVGGAWHGEIVVYCGHGPRAWIAGAALRRAGFRHVSYLRGHWAGWRRARLRVER